jgi:integrase/recombinase XerD
MSWKDRAIQGFKEYLTEKEFIPHTIRKYAGRVKEFINWTEENHLKQIHYSHILNYVQRLRNKEEETVLINAKLLAIRHYFDYENESGNYLLNKIPGYNPAQNLQLKGAKKKILHDYLKKEELEKVFEEYQGKEKVMLGLLIYQGLKAAELERIETLHLDFKKGTIYIPASKKANARLLKLESVQFYELIQLSAEKKENYLLGTDLKNRIHALFKKLRKINPKIQNAHQLRGSLIVHWIQTEGLRQAQYKAGHTTVAATEKYRQVDLKDLQQRINAHHPIQ